jgi:hypothetical protein
VFVLPSQGAQYPGMGLELYRNHRGFARTLDNICEALDAHVEVSLREMMFAEPGSAVGELIHQTRYAQPALFAMGAGCPGRLKNSCRVIKSSRAAACGARMPAPAQLAGPFLHNPDGLTAWMLGHHGKRRGSGIQRTFRTCTVSPKPCVHPSIL